MVSLVSLWLPILLSAVFVFIASSLIHMVLKYHQTDYLGVPDEDGVMSALQPFSIPAGDYVLPHAGTMEVMNTPEYQEKANRGPVVFMTVLPNGVPTMGTSLAQWFGYCVLIGVFVAYLSGRMLSAGADYMTVFRLSGTVAFAGYGLALLQNSIWYKRKWNATFKSVADALVYALVTAGTFGWLWPS